MAERFLDLLGDPIVEPHDGRGRPPHVADDRNRSKVVLLLAMGWTNERIAKTLGVDQKTLRKHYSQQLRVREWALDKVRAGRLALLWDEASKGSVPALKEIGKEIARMDAQQFGDIQASDDRAPNRKRPAALGKKEAQQIAAQTAGHGSEWGDDLLPPSMVN